MLFAQLKSKCIFQSHKSTNWIQTNYFTDWHIIPIYNVSFCIENCCYHAHIIKHSFQLLIKTIFMISSSRLTTNMREEEKFASLFASIVIDTYKIAFSLLWPYTLNCPKRLLRTEKNQIVSKNEIKPNFHFLKWWFEREKNETVTNFMICLSFRHVANLVDRHTCPYIHAVNSSIEPCWSI